VLNVDKACNTNAALWDGFTRLFPAQVAAVSLAPAFEPVHAAKVKREATLVKLEDALEEFKVALRLRARLPAWLSSLLLSLLSSLSSSAILRRHIPHSNMYTHNNNNNNNTHNNNNTNVVVISCLTLR
jgi:hypothetical protein